MMRLAPGIKPAGIKFAAEQGAGFLDLADLGEVFFHIAAKIPRLKKRGQHALPHLVRRIALKERHLYACIHQRLPQRFPVGGVAAEESIFILHLHQDDIAAARDLAGAEHAADLLEIPRGRAEIARIYAAQLHPVLLKHPPGRAAHFPFSAGIRSGTQNHPQPFLLRDAAKRGGVCRPAPVVSTRPWLVEVPE